VRRCAMGEDATEHQLVQSLAAAAAGPATDRADPTIADIAAQLETIVETLRRPPSPNPFSTEPELTEAIQRAKQLGQLSTNGSNAGSPTTELPMPERLGMYQLIERLDAGGMGTVYKAFHIKLKRTVALKVLSTDRFRSPEAVARFEREMQVVGMLRHPHIVEAYDAGEADGTHFLVMELVEGVDLSNLIKRHGPLPIPDACELIRQAAMGLQHICDQGLVHRDLKPSNLMLSRSQDGHRPPCVKILDLGLARQEAPLTDVAPELTFTGQLLGTIDYMAPEQGLDTHCVDIRADLYSLGATLRKLLTDRAPFDHVRTSSVMQRMQALHDETPAPVSSLRADCPPALDALIRRLLSKSPEDRPSTPTELQRALEPFCAGADLSKFVSGPLSPARRPVATAPQSVQRGDAGRGSGRNRWVIPVACAVLGLFGLAALAVFTFRQRDAVITVELSSDEPISSIKVDGYRVEWTHAGNPCTHRFRVQPGDVHAIVLTTAEGSEIVAKIPASGLKIAAGQTYSLQASTVRPTSDSEQAEQSREQAAMRWIHRQRGTFGGGNPESGFRDIGPNDPLPADAFDLVVVSLDQRTFPVGELSQLSGMPSITTISLTQTKVDDAALALLRDLPSLEKLYLSETEISDATLQHLESFPRLQDLHVSFTKVSDAGMSSLAAWPQLSILYLGHCDISDRSVELLAGKTTLRQLHLSGTHVSRDGVERLRAALPHCKIESDYGVFSPE
jgi:serine/threonine protein kinase